MRQWKNGGELCGWKGLKQKGEDALHVVIHVVSKSFAHCVVLAGRVVLFVILSPLFAGISRV